MIMVRLMCCARVAFAEALCSKRQSLICSLALRPNPFSVARPDRDAGCQTTRRRRVRRAFRYIDVLVPVVLFVFRAGRLLARFDKPCYL